VIGIDEISIRKGHTYRIVVSDLIRHRPIWFGGQDRSEASMDEFYRFLGEKKAKRSAWRSWTCGRHSVPRPAVMFSRR
jgi:transposase